MSIHSDEKTVGWIGSLLCSLWLILFCFIHWPVLTFLWVLCYWLCWVELLRYTIHVIFWCFFFFFFCPNWKTLGLLLTMSCLKKKKILALVLFLNSRITVTNSYSLQWKEVLSSSWGSSVFWGGKTNFQGCHLEGFSLRKLIQILSLLSSKGSSIPGSVTLPCLTQLMFIWGKIAILRIIGRASHLSYQFWSLPPSISDIWFYMLLRGIKRKNQENGEGRRWRFHRALCIHSEIQ